jgi:hypothetical protein
VGAAPWGRVLAGLAAEVRGLDGLLPETLCWPPIGVLRRPEGLELIVWELMDWLLMVGLLIDGLLMGWVMAETHVDWKTSAWVWLL